MKLIELNPRWAVDESESVGHGGQIAPEHHRDGMGITFDCPHCRSTRLYVWFLNPVDGGAAAPGVDAQHLWCRMGKTFDELTLSPSVDVSKYGHWHGCIINGTII